MHFALDILRNSTANTVSSIQEVAQSEYMVENIEALNLEEYCIISLMKQNYTNA